MRLKSRLLYGACVGLAIFQAPLLSAAEYHLVPAIAVSEIRNDNVLGVSDPKISDWITVPTPSIAFSVTGNSQQQTFNYSMPFEFFWKRTDLNSISYLGDYKGDFRPDPRLLLSLVQRLTYSPEIASSIFPETSTEPQLFRTKTLRNATEFTPRVQWTERTDVLVSTQFLFQKFKERDLVLTNTFKATNTFQASESVAVEHRLSEQDALLPGISFDHFWFEGDSNATTLGVDLGWNRKWTPWIETRAAAGLLETWQGGGNWLGWTGSASAFYVKAPWETNLAYARKVTGTPASGSAVTEDSVSLGGKYSFLEAWSFGIDGGYFRATSVEESSNGGNWNGVFGGASFVMQVSRWVSATASYEYRTQTGPPSTGTDFTRNLATLTLSVIPPVLEAPRKPL